MLQAVIQIDVLARAFSSFNLTRENTNHFYVT